MISTMMKRVSRQPVGMRNFVCSWCPVSVCASTEGGLFCFDPVTQVRPVATEGGCYPDIMKMIFYCPPKEVLIRKLIGQILRIFWKSSWLVKWWMKIMRSQWLVRIFCYARISVITCVSKDESIALVSRKVSIPKSLARIRQIAEQALSFTALS